MPKATKAVTIDEIENMVTAANEMQGALMALIGNVRSQGFQSGDFDPMSLRQAASGLMCCARECSDIAVLMITESREIERVKQIVNAERMRELQAKLDNLQQGGQS